MQVETSVDDIIDNVRYLEGIMPGIIGKFINDKRKYRSCDELVAGLSGRPHRKNVIRRLCEETGKWRQIFFEPLINWLEKYQQNRRGELAFTRTSLDNFIRRGIVIIHNFVVLTTYFADNFVIYLDSSKDLAEFIYRLDQKLIGCGLDPAFPFLDLSATVQPLVEDLKDMRSYLDTTCVSTRVSILGLKN